MIPHWLPTCEKCQLCLLECRAKGIAPSLFALAWTTCLWQLVRFRGSFHDLQHEIISSHVNVDTFQLSKLMSYLRLLHEHVKAQQEMQMYLQIVSDNYYVKCVVATISYLQVSSATITKIDSVYKNLTTRFCCKCMTVRWQHCKHDIWVRWRACQRQIREGNADRQCKECTI